MTTIQINIPEIPHGHGLSFKKGVAVNRPGNRGGWLGQVVSPPRQAAP